MKTLLQLLLEWCKKNWKYLLLVFLIIFAVIWIAIREAVIVKQTEKLDELRFENNRITLQRNDLEQQLTRKEAQYSVIEKANDSLKTVLTAKQKELKELKKKHQAEIDSLLSVPNDTIFVRLQPIYPNYDNSPLEYPFSGSQIRGIYKTAISYPLLTQEYELQGKNLASCLNLNTGYEAGIANLTDQVTNLKSQIGLCDEQVGNYQKEVKILDRKVKSRGFWRATFFTTTLIATSIAILK